MRFFGSSLLVLASLALAAPAAADEAAPLPAPAPPPSAVTTSVPGCVLGAHDGVDEADARTTADIVCHELVRHDAGGQHEVRLGKLGGKTLVVLASRDGSAYDERRVLVQSAEEIPVAAPRLVDALVLHKNLDDTVQFDNVLQGEARAPKVKPGSMGFDGGLFGATTLGGGGAGASGGIDLGLLYRSEHFGLAAHGRAGGIGSTDNKLGLASLDIGGRLYLSNGDTAPFLGTGVVLGYYQLNRKDEGDLSGSGFGAYAQMGVELLRTHHAAFSASIRADLPFYALKASEQTSIAYDQASGAYATRVTSPSQTAYVIPLSLNVGLVFH